MKVSEIMPLSDNLLNNTKVHFAIGAKDQFEPINAFYSNDFMKWQEDQKIKNFERDNILSLIYIGQDIWLFAGFFKRIHVIKVNNRYKYETELLDLFTDLIGRLVIKFDKRKIRNSYLYLEKYYEKFELFEVKNKRYSVKPFSGYENIYENFSLLKSIFKRNEDSWKIALSSVKGIYLISDLSNGKLYVGSAYGDGGIWSRWEEYVNTGHGNHSVKLKKIIKNNGIEYANNFQFSILETRNMIADKDEIINRENFWMKILQTRTFGYNLNLKKIDILENRV